MRAGEVALGVWLPLALADMVRYLAAWCGEKRVPDVTLDGWGLSDLAAALRRDIEADEERRRVAEWERIIKEWG